MIIQDLSGVVVIHIPQQRKEQIGATMRMVIKTKIPATSKILLKMKFRNIETNSTLRFAIYYPVAHKHYSKVQNAWHSSLRSRVSITLDKKRSNEILGGESWLEILLLGLEYVRRKIPEYEEAKWVDERGVPSWVILPKQIPISWGYSLHKELTENMKLRVEHFVKEVEKKRLRSISE